MIQPKYSPKESLERIKLMMEYDNSKTLSENLNEQVTSLPKGSVRNPYDDTDLEKDVDLVVDYIDGTKGVTGKLAGAITLGAGWTTEQEFEQIYKILMKYKDKYCKDPEDDKKVYPALKRFADLYFEDEGESLEADINNLWNSRWSSRGEQLHKQLLPIIKQIDFKESELKDKLDPLPPPTPAPEDWSKIDIWKTKFPCLVNTGVILDTTKIINHGGLYLLPFSAAGRDETKKHYIDRYGNVYDPYVNFAKRYIRCTVDGREAKAFKATNILEQ